MIDRSRDLERPLGLFERFVVVPTKHEMRGEVAVGGRTSRAVTNSVELLGGAAIPGDRLIETPAPALGPAQIQEPTGSFCYGTDPLRETEGFAKRRHALVQTAQPRVAVSDQPHSGGRGRE